MPTTSPFRSLRHRAVRVRFLVRGVALVAGVATMLIARPAVAQVCGDATGDGLVTVTDGVQTLRAAAQLATTCTLATCDVDGNGSISVTDGVNVLRKAADLSAPDQCGGGGGGDAAEAKSISDAVAPLLLFGFTGISDVSLPGAAARAATVQSAVTQIDEDDCPAGGSRKKILLGACIINVSFDACGYSAPTLGSFEFERVISVNFCRSQVVLSLDVTDIASGRLVQFEGSVSFSPTGDGGFFADGGPIRITTPQGAFDLSFQQLVFDDEGHLKSGAGQITDTDDNFAMATMSLTVTSPTTASVVATFDDNHQASFVLNLITGDFTPA